MRVLGEVVRRRATDGHVPRTAPVTGTGRRGTINSVLPVTRRYSSHPQRPSPMTRRLFLITGMVLALGAWAGAQPSPDDARRQAEAAFAAEVLPLLQSK